MSLIEELNEKLMAEVTFELERLRLELSVALAERDTIRSIDANRKEREKELVSALADRYEEIDQLRAERPEPDPDSGLQALQSACESSLDAMSANRTDRLEGKIRNALAIADGPGFGECDGDMEDALGLLRGALSDPDGSER